MHGICASVGMKPSGPPPFTLGTIAGCRFWMRPDPGFVTLSGGAYVTDVADRTGISGTASYGGAAPNMISLAASDALYNGHPTLAQTSQAYLVTPGTGGTPPAYVIAPPYTFVGVGHSFRAGNSVMFGCDDFYHGGMPAIGTHYTSAALVGGVTAPEWFVSTPQRYTTVPTIIIGVYDVGGVARGYVSSLTKTIDRAWDHAAPTFNSAPMIIGNFGSSWPWGGTVAECGFFQGAVDTDGKLATIMNGLATYYGITLL